MSPPVLLVIDDEKGVRESLRMIFGKDFYVLEADSVDPGIAAVRAEKPAVVLLDLLLPKVDGIEVLRQIKEIHSRCEVIMLTALNSKHASAKALDFGAFDFVGKPFDVSDLRRKVDQALQKFAQQSPS
jgi:DNA-binding response OmpR family regulator